MPGFEVFGKEEKEAIIELFELNGGILFAHGFDAIRNGVFRVREFESAFANKMGVPYAQAVSSGSAALKVGLEALGVGVGDEVIIPCFTFVASAEAIIQTGATPVIVDIDDSLNICPKSIENTISDRTKVIMPVHMMGAPADMDAIMSLAEKHHLHVLEDTAQACGGSYKGRPLGTIGDIGSFSFDAGKVIITGEGGMVVMKDEALFIKARAYHDHGHEYDLSVGRGVDGAISDGFNYRMTEIQGAIGIVQLGKLDTIIEKQRKNKNKLLSTIKDLPFEFRRMNDQDGEIGDAIIFYLESKESALKFVEGLKNEGLGTKNIPDAMRWHFAKFWRHMFEKYGWYKDSFGSQWQQSADILERAVALPVMVNMTDEQIESIGEKILQIAEKL